MKYIMRLLVHIQRYLARFTCPPTEDLVLALVLQTASLELPKGASIHLAPIKGLCGPFRLSGNSLPVFEYEVFEKKIMEFIAVRVEVSRPDRIQFLCTIKSDTAPERNGEVVKTQDKYKEPFNVLAQHLYRYFPYYRKEK